ncbi:amidase signature domain-containing protein [Suillus spraguei]|nr:amidase signature domain-containing protein [Suillus spraguei]
MRSTEKRNSIITSKRNARDKALGFAGPYLGNDHGIYTKATASEIVQRIAKGEWTSSEVLEAYIARSAMAQAKIHHFSSGISILTPFTVLYEDARKQAKELDAEFASTKTLRGPFHGVPVSVKDNYQIEGYDATIGFTAWANNPGKKDACVIAQLRAAGAIIFVKTNVPQTMLAFECSNPLWGRTTNPWNDKYTCGGSSGGEGALLAMDGSALGIGSDIGGSLRIPASYCGVYSLKPTAERVSSIGTQAVRPGFEAIRSSHGPLTRLVATCITWLIRDYFLGLVSPKFPMPYHAVELPSKLRFGYYLSGTMIWHVGIITCMQTSSTGDSLSLRKQGHECIEFTSPLNASAMEVFLGLTSSDGYKKMLSHLDSDPMARGQFIPGHLGSQLPSFVCKLACWIAKTFLGDSLFPRFFSLARRSAAAWYEQVWDKYGFDGIIAPVQSLPVIPHGGATYLSVLAAAPLRTTLSTLLSAPYQRLGRSKMFETRMYLGKNPVYDPKAMEGIPVGVQLVGKKREDEKVLAMMHVVDAHWDLEDSVRAVGNLSRPCRSEVLQPVLPGPSSNLTGGGLFLKSS